MASMWMFSAKCTMIHILQYTCMYVFIYKKILYKNEECYIRSTNKKTIYTLFLLGKKTISQIIICEMVFL